MKIFSFILFFICTASLTAQKTDSLPSRVYTWESLEATKKEGLIRRQIMEGSTKALSWFEVHSSTLEPGKAPHPPHVHTGQDELIIIKEGLLRITINDTTKIIGAGSVAYIMAGDKHGVENAGSTPATYYIFKYQSKLPAIPERASQNKASFIVDKDDVPVTITDRGSRRAFFNRATSQLEKFEMHTTALDEGRDSHAPHIHVEEEIILILKGNADMFIAGFLYKAVPGDVIFLSSGVLHALKNTGTGACEYFAFQWRK